MKLKVLFFGAFAPVHSGISNRATSTAGALFQENLIEALDEHVGGLAHIYSYLPMPSFPKHRSLFFFGGRSTTRSGRPITYLPFINFGPLKTMTLGTAAFVCAVWWGLTQPRDCKKFIMSYNLNAPPALPIHLACRLVGARFVPFVGDIYVPGEVIKDTAHNRAQFSAQRRIASQLKWVIAANKHIVEDFAPTADFVLVEGGVTSSFLESFSEPPMTRITTTVLFAGGLTELNGIPLLLEAIRLVPNSEFRFVIAGRGDKEQIIRQFASADDRVQFVGHVNHDAVIELYKNADILVSLRRTNNLTHRYVFPSKTIECIATGRPLITTATGHMATEFSHVVSIVNEESPSAVAQKMLELSSWTTQQRVEHHRSAREYVLKNRTWKANVERIHSLMERNAA